MNPDDNIIKNIFFFFFYLHWNLILNQLVSQPLDCHQSLATLCTNRAETFSFSIPRPGRPSSVHLPVCPGPVHRPAPPSHTEQLRLFPEPAWAVAAEGEVSQVATPCQRLVEETERVGDEGGGKFSSSRTATPTLLRRVNMQDAATHLLLRGLYFSMELRLELPSLPPTAYSQPSMATRSCVLLDEGK